MDLNINSAWSASSAVLRNFSFYDIKEIVGLAGFDSSHISHLVQRSGSSASKGQLITEIEQGLSEFTDEEKRHFVNIVIEEMLDRSSNEIKGSASLICVTFPVSPMSGQSS